MPVTLKQLEKENSKLKEELAYIRQELYETQQRLEDVYNKAYHAGMLAGKPEN